MPGDLFPADWLVTFEYEETVLGALKSGKESEVYLVARTAHGRRPRLRSTTISSRNRSATCAWSSTTAPPSPIRAAASCAR